MCVSIARRYCSSAPLNRANRTNANSREEERIESRPVRKDRRVSTIAIATLFRGTLHAETRSASDANKRKLEGKVDSTNGGRNTSAETPGEDVCCVFVSTQAQTLTTGGASVFEF